MVTLRENGSAPHKPPPRLAGYVDPIAQKGPVQSPDRKMMDLTGPNSII